MMGERRVDQAALCYEVSLERHAPLDHMLRSIDRLVDLEDPRAHLAAFYSPIGRPSGDPELLIRMLLVGYCFGIHSTRPRAGSPPIRRLAFFAYATNSLIDLDHAVIADVEASTAIRTAEVTTARTMIERVRKQHDLSP